MLSRFLFLVSIAARSLLRTPRRTAFNLLSIAAATAAILVFESFVDSLTKSTRKSVITAHYAHYEITKKEYKKNKIEKPFSHQMVNFEQIRDSINQKISPLIFASRRQDFFGLLNYNDKSFGAIALGVDAGEEKKFLTLAQVTEGKHLADSPENSAFVGKGVADSLSLKIGDNVTFLVTTSSGSINAVDLTVTGIFQTGVLDLDDRTFYIHQSIVPDLLKVKGVEKILIAFKDDDELKFQDSLNNLLSTEFPDLRASHWLERAPFYTNMMGWLNKQVRVFYGIVLLIAVISILNVFTVGLLERTGEFGTLRAIGTYTNEISLLIFLESMIQALVGSVLGIVLGIIIVVLPLRNGITMPPPPMMSVPLLVMFAVPWGKMLSTICLCTMVAGVSGLLPAVRIGRMNIVKALGRNI